MNRIKRARGTNSVMTGVFYLIAVFFFALLISFASYVIIKGFSGATSEMFRFLRKVLETSYSIRFILYSYHWYFPYRLE